ncbi:MAG: hypothetical protein V7785_00575 [Bermanella sp.]
MYRISKLIICLAIICLSSCSTTSQKDVSDFEKTSADIYFVPIGPLAPEYIVSLATYYEDVFNLNIGITPPLPYSSKVYNSERKQLIAQELITLMRETFDSVYQNEKAIFIGVTHSDMYIEGKSWRFAYAQRQGLNYAVHSSSRTSRKQQPKFLDIKNVHPGLRKMITKTVGLLHYRKPMNSNPESVLYNRVLGLDDLNIINESTVYKDILDL